MSTYYFFPTLYSFRYTCICVYYIILNYAVNSFCNSTKNYSNRKKEAEWRKICGIRYLKSQIFTHNFFFLSSILYCFKTIVANSGNKSFLIKIILLKKFFIITAHFVSINYQLYCRRLVL